MKNKSHQPNPMLYGIAFAIGYLNMLLIDTSKITKHYWEQSYKQSWTK